jgi:teichuronic acid biosynthesis glycosyltransferase TuaG
LESIFRQTYKNFKILIIYDDTDKKDLKRLEKYLKKEKINKKYSIKIIVNKRNIGPGRSRNVGINNCISKYVAFIDSDDTWHKDKLKKQISFMKKKKLVISHTSYDVFDYDGKKISTREAKSRIYFKDLLKSCDIGLSTIILDCVFLKKNNFYFPNNIKTKEDYILWLNIAKKINVIRGINISLMNYRKTKNSLSSDIFMNLSNGYKVYRNYMHYSVLKSFYSLLRLSLNYLKKTYVK